LTSIFWEKFEKFSYLFGTWKSCFFRAVIEVFSFPESFENVPSYQGKVFFSQNHNFDAKHKLFFAVLLSGNWGNPN